MSVQLRLLLIVLLLVGFVFLRPKLRRKVVDGVRDIINPGTGKIPVVTEQYEAKPAGPPPPESVGGGIERKMIEIGGREIWYLEGARAAERPTVLLLHGFVGDKEQWLPLMALLMRGGCHVVAPDLPGCGQNDKDPQGAYDVTAQAKRMRAFAVRTCGKGLHLVGASMGATVAGALAYAVRDQVESLTLIEPFGVRVPYESELDKALKDGRNPLIISSPGGYEELESFLTVQRPARDRFHTERVRRTAGDRQINLKIWKDVREGEHPNLLDLLLPELQVRTLALVGEESKVVHPAAGEVIASSMRTARAVKIPACGHLPMLEKPGDVARYLLEHFELDGGKEDADAALASG